MIENARTFAFGGNINRSAQRGPPFVIASNPDIETSPSAGNARRIQGGSLDEGYHGYGEYIDLGWRTRKAGWERWYVPEAVAQHRPLVHKHPENSQRF